MIDLTGGTPVVYFYYYDGLGSVVALSNTSGSILEQYRYDAFGSTKVLNGSGTEKTDPATFLGNPYMFTGRRYDAESGLYYYRTRMYNPKLGRFMQTDPIGYYDSMNLYQYCGNNPVNWIDPWGLDSVAIYYAGDHNLRRESADDFDYYQEVKNTQDALRYLRKLKIKGIEIDDLYIFGHGVSGYDDGAHQQIGNETMKGCDKRWEMIGNKIEEDGSLHLRGCNIGTKSQKYLKKVAKTANRNTTGFDDLTHHTGEIYMGGPDYYNHGNLWEATPSGNVNKLLNLSAWTIYFTFGRW